MLSKNNIYCLKPWESLLVFADGKVRFCCFMKENLGNLNYQTFESIWNGVRAQRIRKAFLNNQIPDACSLCPLVNHYDSVTKNQIKK